MDDSPIVAYTVPYATYRLLLCLRCAKPYPDGGDKEPVGVAPLFNRCDKCHAVIPRKAQP